MKIPPIRMYSKDLDYTKAMKLDFYEWEKDPVKLKKSKYGTLKKGDLIFQYTNEPLLGTRHYNRLCKKYSLAKGFYSTLSFTYGTLFSECRNWYEKKIAVRNSFDYSLQIDRYKKLIKDDYSCPIVKYIDPEKLHNVDFIQHFESMLSYAETRGITSYNLLFYGVEKADLRNKPNELACEIFTSIQNIVYYRFLSFLEKKHRDIETKKSKSTINSSSLGLTSNLSKIQLRKVYKYITEKKYIKPTDFTIFFDCLSGNEILPKNRIVWKGKRSYAFCLFKEISYGFNIKAFNNSVLHIDKKKFKSNNRPKHGFQEIEQLVSSIKLS